MLASVVFWCGMGGLQAPPAQDADLPGYVPVAEPEDIIPEDDKASDTKKPVVGGGDDFIN